MFTTLPRNESKIIGYSEGNKNSLAENIIKFLDENEKEYPYLKKYHFFPGQNSNTFVQWVINKFPEVKLKLFWNAIGKNYKFL